MGKVGGFLEHQRRLAPKRPVQERLRDYREIPLRAGSALVREQAGRCMDCGVPFCHHGCPLGNLIPEWNDLVHRDDWANAIRRLHLTNNFPEFTGRLCPAPCEPACVLAVNDEAVTIKQVEVSIVDRAFEEGWIHPEPPAHRSGQRVAVIGSGPAGLAAAQQLNRMGHWVTVFERSDRPGGLLRYGIPDFKLEKWVLDRRLDLMAAEGVAFECGTDAGIDIGADVLLQQFHALVVATGAQVPRDLPVPGRELRGVHFAMEYLEQQNRRVAGEAIDSRVRISARGRNVVILGGGDTGADCLGNVLRERCASVQQFELLPEPPASRAPENPWPLWPLIMRSSSAHEEGGDRGFALQTTALTGSRRVEHLHAIRVEATMAEGRARLDAVAGTESTHAADLVLLAMGFLHPRHLGLIAALGLELDSRGNIATDAAQCSSHPRVFAAGDARRGQSLIVHAIAEGRRAAAGCDAALRVGSLEHAS